MITKIKDLKFLAGAKNLAVQYGRNDFDTMKKQGAVAVTQISAVTKAKPKEVPFFVAVGIDKDGELMVSPNNEAALPCPPDCEPPQEFINIDKF